MPALEALRRERPDARIDWLVEDRAAALLEHHPAIDRVHVVPRSRWRERLRRPWRWPQVAFEAAGLVLRLWKARYDAALDLQGNLKSGLWSLFSGAPSRYGFATSDVREGNGFLTNRHVPTGNTHPHHADRAFALVAGALGREPFAYARPAIPRSAAARAWVDAALLRAGVPSGGYGIVHPGTSGFGAFKRWPAERFGRLARRIVEGGVPVLVTVGPGEEATGAEVTRAAGGVATVVAPPDLGALAELLSRASFFVSADTGPLHVAAAQGVPVVALFGPPDPAIYGPHAEIGREALTEVVTADDVACRPCTLRRCPDPVCMTSISVDAVHERVRRVTAAAR
jgi:ADP-heptose:LPS heptosyltransferase